MVFAGLMQKKVRVQLTPILPAPQVLTVDRNGNEMNINVLCETVHGPELHRFDS